MPAPIEGPGLAIDAETFMRSVDSGQSAPTQTAVETPPTTAPPTTAPPTRREEPVVVRTDADVQGMGIPLPQSAGMPTTSPAADDEIKRQIAELKQRIQEQDKGIQKTLQEFADVRKERDVLKQQTAEKESLFTPPTTYTQPQWASQQSQPRFAEEGPLIPQEVYENPEELVRHLADVVTVQAQQQAALQQQLYQFQNAWASDYNQRQYRGQYDNVKEIYEPMWKKVGVEFPDYPTVERIAASQGYFNTVVDPIQQAINRYAEVKSRELNTVPGAETPQVPLQAAPVVQEPPAGLQTPPVSGHPARTIPPRFQPGAATQEEEGPFVFTTRTGRGDHDAALRAARQRAGLD